MPLDFTDRSFVTHAKNFFDVETMRRVRTFFDDNEERLQSVVREGNPSDERSRYLGTGTDAFRFVSIWYDLWRTLDQRHVDWLKPYSWLIFPVQVRHLVKPEHLVPWHQDLGYQVLLGSRAHRQVITCFVPLEYDPADACSLEFVEGETNQLEHEVVGWHGACLQNYNPKTVVRFDLAFGDALIFGDHAPHQTILPPSGRIDRRSFEFRLVRPEDAIDGKDYFDLDKRKFVRTDGSERDVL